ncbi:homeodomain superfamily [Lecanora helva]
MPQAVPAVSVPSREGKKRRGYEAALSPRSSPPTRAPMAGHERLPPIRSLLSDIPDRNDHTLSQLRTPMRQDATGPRPAIPARLSPPPPSRRSQVQSNSDPRTPRRVEDRSSGRSNYDSQPVVQLPIHSGPPGSRSSYSPSTLGSAPVSPYSSTSSDTRRYTNGSSSSLPPPPPPPTTYRNGTNGRASAYAHSSDYRNGDSYYGGSYYCDGRNKDSRAPPYQSQHPSCAPLQSYSYHPPPPPSTNGSYGVHHQYSGSYHHGSFQFESDDSSGQAPRRRRGNLPRDTTDLLKQWFADHLGHPYPTEDEKQMLCRQTGLQMTQISNWFINARRRRIPELMNQATAETRLRENSGESSGSSD